jgi:hypothetical protein
MSCPQLKVHEEQMYYIIAMVLIICESLKFRGGCNSVMCYMQIGVQGVCTLPNPAKESKEHPSNMQITKIQNLRGRRKESVFLLHI